MIAILTLLTVIGCSMLVTKVATVALEHTGMSRDMARFQARSAFTGAGFTTTESEEVVRHPLRRKIIVWLIILGNAGLVSAVSSLILGFTGEESFLKDFSNLLMLFLGISALFLTAYSRIFDRLLSTAIISLLDKFTDIRPKKYVRLFNIRGDYEINELSVEKDSWMEDKSLSELELPAEGILVLGIYTQSQEYIGVPRGKYEIQEGDRLIVYGKSDTVENLSKRHDSLAAKLEHKETAEKTEQEVQHQEKNN